MITWVCVGITILFVLGLAYSNAHSVEISLDNPEESENLPCCLCGAADSHRHEPDYLCHDCCMMEMTEENDFKSKWIETLIQHAHEREELLRELVDKK